MRNCRIFRILSRLSILLVIIGFFQPVACGFSGPEIVQYSLEEGPLPIIVSSVLLLLAFFISIIMILRIRKKSEKELIASPVIISAILILSYFSAHIEIGDFMEYVSYDRGAKMIASGIILSLVFAIMHYASTGKERSERLYKSILDESAEALISSYERAGYEIETHKYEPLKASAISLEDHGETETYVIKEGIERVSSIHFSSEYEVRGPVSASLLINDRCVSKATGAELHQLKIFKVKEGDRVALQFGTEEGLDALFSGSPEILLFRKKQTQ